MAISQQSDGVRAAQSVLKLSHPNLVIDGYWGSFTQGVYEASSTSDKARVAAVLAALNAPTPETLTQIYNARKAAKDESLVEERATARAERENVTGTAAQLDKATGARRYIDLPAATRYIKEVVRILNNPIVTEELLLRKLNVEAAKTKINQTVYYDTEAINSSGYRGLYQFDKSGNAWADASKIIALPEFGGPNGWINPFYNTLAAGAYAIFNSRVLRTEGYKGPITLNTLYLAHNQGAAGAARILTGKRGLAGLQSSEAVKLSKLAIADAKDRKSVV